MKQNIPSLEQKLRREIAQDLGLAISTTDARTLLDIAGEQEVTARRVASVLHHVGSLKGKAKAIASLANGFIGSEERLYRGELEKIKSTDDFRDRLQRLIQKDPASSPLVERGQRWGVQEAIAHYLEQLGKADAVKIYEELAESLASESRRCRKKARAMHEKDSEVAQRRVGQDMERGDLWFEKQEYLKALNCYSHAAAKDHTNVHPLLKKAETYRVMHDLQKALLFARQALELDPANTKAEEMVKQLTKRKNTKRGKDR